MATAARLAACPVTICPKELKQSYDLADFYQGFFQDRSVIEFKQLTNYKLNIPLFIVSVSPGQVYKAKTVDQRNQIYTLISREPIKPGRFYVFKAFFQKSARILGAITIQCDLESEWRQSYALPLENTAGKFADVNKIQPHFLLGKYDGHQFESGSPLQCQWDMRGFYGVQQTVGPLELKMNSLQFVDEAFFKLLKVVTQKLDKIQHNQLQAPAQVQVGDVNKKKVEVKTSRNDVQGDLTVKQLEVSPVNNQIDAQKNLQSIELKFLENVPIEAQNEINNQSRANHENGAGRHINEAIKSNQTDLKKVLKKIDLSSANQESIGVNEPANANEEENVVSNSKEQSQPKQNDQIAVRQNQDSDYQIIDTNQNQGEKFDFMNQEEKETPPDLLYGPQPKENTQGNNEQKNDLGPLNDLEIQLEPPAQPKCFAENDFQHFSQNIHRQQKTQISPDLHLARLEVSRFRLPKLLINFSRQRCIPFLPRFQGDFYVFAVQKEFYLVNSNVFASFVNKMLDRFAKTPKKLNQVKFQEYTKDKFNLFDVETEFQNVLLVVYGRFVVEIVM